MDLQYLPEDKKREEDPDIRKMLLETLLLVRHNKHTCQPHVSVVRSSLFVSPAADRHQIRPADAQRQESLSDHERVPQLGEGRPRQGGL